MNKKILISLISTTLFMFAGSDVNLNKKDMIDFGINGQMYDIKEDHFMKDIEKRVNQKELRKKMLASLKKAVNEQVISKPNLPYIKEKNRYIIDNYVVLDKDIKNLDGTVIYPAGTKRLIKNTMKVDICFMEGSNPALLKNQIDYFDKLTKERSGEHGECVYFVANKSIKDLDEKYNPKKFYPLKKQYARNFMVKSIPTYIHIQNGKREVISFPIDMFKHEVK